MSYQIGPKSVITFPSGGQQLPGKGFYEISGLAWSGGGAIKLVEVSTDGGKKWNKAEFKGTPQRMAHARFGYQWNWDGKETELQSRCTDEIGQVQPSRAQIAKYWNKPFDATFSVPGLDNSIQPWRIAKRRERDQWARVGFFAFAFALLMGVSALAQVAYLWSGTHADRRGNPRVGYLHRPDRRGTPAGTRNRQGGRAGLSREGVRGMPRRDGDRRHGAHSEKQRSPRILTSGREDESCRFARRSRRRSGITSIAPCLSIERGR